MSVNRLKWIAPLIVGLISVLAKGSPQGLQVEGDRLVLSKASYSKWQGTVLPGVPETVRKWIVSYLDEPAQLRLRLRGIPGARNVHWDWVLMGSNEGQVRYVDGKSEHLVETEDGIPTKKRIWEVTRGSIDSFGSLAGFLSPSTNYRFMPNGEGEFTFQSKRGDAPCQWIHERRKKKGRERLPDLGNCLGREVFARHPEVY